MRHTSFRTTIKYRAPEIAVTTTSTESRSLAALLQMQPHQWARCSPLQGVSFAPFQRAGVKLSLKREDLLHPQASGNKLYKLFGHLQSARQLGATTLSSFGGYYSNHLHALACVGEAIGLTTKGVVRGHRPKRLSPTLNDCLARGMSLEFVSRHEYAQLKADCLHGSRSNRVLGGTYWIPEGGGAIDGITGCEAIVQGIKSQLPGHGQPLTLCIPVGTGTTAAGILSQLGPQDSLLGFSALKFGVGLCDIEKDIRKLAGNDQSCWQLFDELHFGGFAKAREHLFEFMASFTRSTGILLDPVYTAKTLYGMTQELQRGRWQRDEHLIMIHTGGLQGRRGFAQLASQHQYNESNSVGEQ